MEEITAKKEVLKAQFDALQFLTNRYIDNVWRHTGIHLLAAGWIVSSQGLQKALNESQRTKIVLVLMFIVLQSVHSFINIPIYCDGIRKLEAQVKESISDLAKNYPPPLDERYPALYKHYGVSFQRFIWNELMIAVIAIFGIGYIISS